MLFISVLVIIFPLNCFRLWISVNLEMKLERKKENWILQVCLCNCLCQIFRDMLWKYIAIFL